MDSIINKTAFFVISKGKPGGAERRYYYLYEYYLSKGKVPLLITNTELFDSLSVDGLLDTNVFNMNLKGSRFIAPFKFIFSSLLYIRKNNVKHVHFCVNPSIYSFLMVRTLKILGCTTSVSIVNSIIRGNSDLSVLNKFFWEKTIQSVDIIDALSPSIATNMTNIFGIEKFRKKKMSISPCSFSRIADLISDDERNRINFHSRPYDFVFASRLIEGKGLELLLDALILCDSEGHSFTVLICGNGPLESKVKTIKLKNIKLVYLGYIKDIYEVLLLSKVALSLQTYENYPSQFLLESLAANCNIICTDVGDTRFLLNDEISVLIENSVLSLKNALLEIKCDYSPKRRNSVSRVLKKHSVSSFADYIEGVVLECQI
ncbi:glycosyltransferase [Shewanella sedimentimangrovi]|uniref:Glycosyltransferase n=1 Tax=Shewanella sedimentimangrovi TaxID=2814293 RepID=A0ABX7QYV2_9GAMM|nr:glycosyltransferase [Shewanella sedimentimangrovi]QSX36030.1 glycosyltransferase [Shewanella sedimentimangrovi]